MVPRSFGVSMFVAGFIPGASLTFAQAPVSAPAFELASIKPTDRDHAMSISRSGNRLTFSNYSLEMLILWAFDIRSERLG